MPAAPLPEWSYSLAPAWQTQILEISARFGHRSTSDRSALQTDEPAAKRGIDEPHGGDDVTARGNAPGNGVANPPSPERPKSTRPSYCPRKHLKAGSLSDPTS